MEQDTIAAISTAVSNSGIGIIRISGKDAVAVADRVYRSKGGKKRLADQPTHTIHYGYIVDQGETVDEVLVTHAFRITASCSSEKRRWLSTSDILPIE